MKTTFYKKVGKRYKPVSEYDSEWLDAVPIGTTTMIHSYKNGRSRKYDIDPSLAPMVAASMVLQDKMLDIMRKASEFRPEKEPITQEQADAWENMRKVFGQDLCTLRGPSMYDVAENILKAISNEAEKLLTNESTKQAYEHFLTIAALSKK